MKETETPCETLNSNCLAKRVFDMRWNLFVYFSFLLLNFTAAKTIHWDIITIQWNENTLAFVGFAACTIAVISALKQTSLLNR